MDHRDRSLVRGRRAERRSDLTGTGVMGNVEEQTDEIVDEVARAARGRLMAVVLGNGTGKESRR